nr:GNAT family N-acetyltransferase [Aurantimonas sp. VKM B-3413]
MRQDDLPAVGGLAARAHPDLPEDDAVFAERLALFPEGALILAAGDRVAGYAVGHPFHCAGPPKLNTLLGALPARPDCLYIHDIVVAPELRGQGLAAGGVEALLNLAEPYPATTLVSVYGTAAFWTRFGFEDASDRMAPDVLAGYGPDARWMVRVTRA